MNDKILKLKELLMTVEYANLTADEQLAEANNPNKSFIRVLTTRTLLKWSAGGGRAARLKRAAEDNLLSEAVQAAAYAAFKMLDRADAELDLNGAEEMGLVDSLVAAGVLTGSDKTSLIAIASTDTGTDAERFGVVTQGNQVFLGHILQARTLAGQ